LRRVKFQKSDTYIPHLRFHDARGVAGQNQAEEDEGAEEDVTTAWGSEWTVRKAAAKSLDDVSQGYGDEVLNAALNVVQQSQHSNINIKHSIY
jgi:hypothetical protein